MIADHHLPREFVLAAVRDCLTDVLGIDPEEANFEWEHNLIEWMQSLGGGIYEELDLADLYYRFLDFGIDASHTEFVEFMTGGATTAAEWEHQVERLTFGRLCDWLAVRTSMPSYAPLDIAGIRCRPAGVYLGIREVAQSVSPTKQFGPSSRIVDVIGAHRIQRLWQRLRLHSGGELPELRWPLEDLGAGCCLLGGAGMFLFLIGVCAGGDSTAGAFVLFSMLCVLLGQLLGSIGNPLPDRIVTFRDLATEMDAALARAGEGKTG